MEWIQIAMPTALASYIQGEIKTRQWTERYFEDVTGVSKTALRSMMTGKTGVPKLETLDRIAKAFQVPRAYLEELCGFPEDVHLTVDELRVLATLTEAQRAALIAVARQMTRDDAGKS